MSAESLRRPSSEGSRAPGTPPSETGERAPAADRAPAAGRATARDARSWPATSDGPLLKPADIRALERLSLDSLAALVAGLGGQREASGQSAGFEFVDYRRYTPGDDIRRIDWNIYARLRELHVRTAPQEARVSLAVLLDASASMDFGEPNKLYYGRRLAALLGAVALLGTDAVQVQTLRDGGAFSGGLLDAAGMLNALVADLERLPVGTTTQLTNSVRRARDVGGQPEVAVLISDALVDEDDMGTALRELARGARSAALLHVANPAEAVSGPPGGVQLRDLESGRSIDVVITDEISERYREQYALFFARVEQQCRANGVRYLAAPTDVDPLELLLRIARDETLLRSGSAR
jgi:uncharacterized protein (DUF58 family)